MMVRLLKEDQAGKSEEELAECFRVFDKYVSTLDASRLERSLNVIKYPTHVTFPFVLQEC